MPHTLVVFLIIHTIQAVALVAFLLSSSITPFIVIPVIIAFVVAGGQVCNAYYLGLAAGRLEILKEQRKTLIEHGELLEKYGELLEEHDELLKKTEKTIDEKNADK